MLRRPLTHLHACRKCFSSLIRQRAHPILTLLGACLLLLSVFFHLSHPREALPRTNNHPLVIYNHGYYRPLSTQPTPTTYEQIIKILRWHNSGDLVWQYAALSLLDPSNSHLCCLSVLECMQRARAQRRRAILYWPVANLLAERDTFEVRRLAMQHIHDIMQNFSVPVILLGLGSQGQFVRNPAHRDLSPGHEVELSASTYDLSTEGIEMLHMLNSMSAPMFVRGQFTMAVARKFGAQRGIENGCPSLMINGDVSMGRRLQLKYAHLKPKLADRTIRMAINVKPHMPHLLQLYLDLLDQFPSSLLFAQESNDLRAFRDHGVPISRVRTFLAYEPWRDELCKMDVSVGSRIHGNMAALGCPDPVPVLAIAPDHRVLELARAMLLPHITIFSLDLRKGVKGIVDALQGVSFDGAAFDQNRCLKGRAYIVVFRRYGIQPTQKLRRIASSCA